MTTVAGSQIRETSRTPARSVDTARAAVLFAFFLGGLCALAYEVVWFRMLNMVFANITYALSVMLATVLFGIALGSAVTEPWIDKLSSSRRWALFGVIEITIAVTALLSVQVLAQVDGIIARIVSLPGISVIQALPDHQIFLAALIAIGPAMFFSGMAFPVAATLFAEGSGDDTRPVGVLYSGNLVGSILGSLLGGFVLLPVLGSQSALFLLAAGSTFAGLLVVWAAPRGTVSIPWRAGISIVGVGVVLLVAANTPSLSERLLANKFPGQDVLFYREGLENNVMVVREPDGYITLFTNSRGQSRDEPGLMGFHRLIGHMPAILHDNPRNALIVGVGAGSTTGIITQYPGMQTTVAELSDGVIEASPFFGHVNYEYYDNPDVRIRQVDARNYMLTSNQKYDIIAGDAIQPMDAGAATLYSKEYFELVANSLTDDGLFVQWLPSASEWQYKLIMRTFLEAFPYATLWENGDILIGSKKPLTIDPARVERTMADPKVRSALELVNMTTPAGLLGKFAAGPDEMRAYAGEGPIMTDDRPYIEYFRSLPQDGPARNTWSKNWQSVVRPAGS